MRGRIDDVNVPMIGVNAMQEATGPAAVLGIILEDGRVGDGVKKILHADGFLDHFLLSVLSDPEMAGSRLTAKS